MNLHDKMHHGQGPDSPEEWQEFALVIDAITNMLHSINAELDAIEATLDLLVVPDPQEEGLKNLLVAVTKERKPDAPKSDHPLD